MIDLIYFKLHFQDVQAGLFNDAFEATKYQYKIIICFYTLHYKIREE